MMDKKLNIVFYEPNPICPQCGSEVRNNGRRIRDINRNFAVKIQKYVCKNEKCNYYFETNLEKIVPKHCNYSYTVRKHPIKQLEIDYSSLEKVQEQIDVNYGCKPSRTTIYNFKNEAFENTIKEKILKELKYIDKDLSGVLGYDEQYLKVNGE